MRRFSRRLFPRMFHRRLLLLVAVACAAMVVILWRVIDLTVVHGHALHVQAEEALIRSRLIPTIRGSIRDRRGRQIAYDRPCYNLAVSYSVLSGQWAYHSARRDVITQNTTQWRQLTERERFRRIVTCQTPYEQQVHGLWNTLSALSGVAPGDLEQRRSQIIGQVERLATSHKRTTLIRLARRSNEPPHLRDVAHRQVAEQRQYHMLIEDVDDSIRFDVQRRIVAATQSSRSNVWAQVQIQFAVARQYPWRRAKVAFDRFTLPSPLRHDDQLATTLEDIDRHILGRMRRRPWKEEVAANRFDPATNRQGYQGDDPIGAWGLEQSMETHLRGSRGYQLRHQRGGTLKDDPPVPGGDVVTTVDMRLQARLAAIMDPASTGPGLMRSQPWHKKPDKPLVPRDDEALCGAAVVIAIETGHVLAAVSVPWQSPKELANDRQGLKRWKRVNKPSCNRVVAAPYPPGSTVKPLLLAAAYTDGKLGYGQSLNCHAGSLYPDDPNHFRCWTYRMGFRPHGELNGPQAIMRSCNMFFFQVGQRLTARGLRTWFERYGLGKVTDCGLEELATHGATGRGGKAAALMAIGQGPVEWTVLQAASAYATLAREGRTITPSFLADTPPRPATDFTLARRGVELALEGMALSANDPNGTSGTLPLPDNRREKVFNLTDVEIYAKSGTAEAPDLRITTQDSDGRFLRQVVRQGDHAWMIVLANRPDATRPEFVVAVVVEYGGSGGRVAGPIANQILHALRYEGYL